jgi:hypothetical protein
MMCRSSVLVRTFASQSRAADIEHWSIIRVHQLESVAIRDDLNLGVVCGVWIPANNKSAHANNKSSAQLTVQSDAVHQCPHRTALVLPDRSGDPGYPVRGVDLVLVESLFA